MFWRLVYPRNRKPDGACACVPDSSLAAGAGDVQRFMPGWADESFLKSCGGAIGVLVAGQSSRRRSSWHYGSVWSGAFPEGSFFDCGGGAFVSSPCFTFLQMAAELGLYELIAYGDEICGNYSFDACAPGGIRQRSRPLVTVAQLERYLAAARGCRGHKLAMKALAFIVEGSASPMETVDEMLLCLPYRHGGYSVAGPEMNHRIDLDEKLARLAGRHYCRADICWPDRLLVIEHQGARDHSDADSFSSDRARINALVTMGFEVLELTHGQVSDLQAFEEIALHVAGVLGKRVDKRKLGATPERIALRKELFEWNQRNGRVRLAVRVRGRARWM